MVVVTKSMLKYLLYKSIKRGVRIEDIDKRKIWANGNDRVSTEIW